MCVCYLASLPITISLFVHHSGFTVYPFHFWLGFSIPIATYCARVHYWFFIFVVIVSAFFFSSTDAIFSALHRDNIQSFDILRLEIFRGTIRALICKAANWIYLQLSINIIWFFEFISSVFWPHVCRGIRVALLALAQNTHSLRFRTERR